MKAARNKRRLETAGREIGGSITTLGGDAKRVAIGEKGKIEKEDYPAVETLDFAV